MGIKSIKINNVLSFDELIINDIKDINCIVGKNNTGKSNLLKLLRYFYKKLEGKKELTPSLNSSYTTFGTIILTYDISHISKIVRANKNMYNEQQSYFKEIFNLLVEPNTNNIFELKLTIYDNESIKWNIKDNNLLRMISDLYPFFDIETRHINLYDWDKIWFLVSRLKPFNPHRAEQKDIIELFEKLVSRNTEYPNYEKYINNIEEYIETGKYNYKDKVLSLVKAGLSGHSFLINKKNLETESDGINSFTFIKSFLTLLIALTRKAYITPFLYIDEAEIGLHPKRNEELIQGLYEVCQDFNDYNTPLPKIFFSTHSPNIVKEVIKLFNQNQKILHFSKDKQDNTLVQKMNSIYDDSDGKRFINIFSDNEARLFFSSFILFVEGATEVEVFGNRKLIEKFSQLKEIDVYETNELVLKHVNPSHANTSIPYIVLYDADKLIKIDIGKGKLNFINQKINLITYLNVYKKSYFGSKHRLMYDLLKQLLDWEKSINVQFDNNLYISNIKYDFLVKYINKYFLSEDNYLINKTTIEEVLINADSFCLFKRWLFKEFRKVIDTSFNENTPLWRKAQIKRAKIKEIRNFKKFMDSAFPTEKEKITVMILVFGGKTETSVTTQTKNYSLLDESLKKNIKIIKEKLKKSLKIGHLLGKTSGWATSFLNFSIEEIEKNQGENNFKDEFKKYFEELYDIIKSVEDKL